jgi:hypothetical protein
MRWSLARIFAYTRQLEDTLARREEEHGKELSRVNAERAREREDRRAAERRAADAEKLLHDRESEFFYKLSALARLPASAAEIAAVHRARSQVQSDGKKPSMGVHTISQIRRQQEEESLRRAAQDRENGTRSPQEARMAEEAEAFQGNHNA